MFYVHINCFNVFPFIKDVINKLFNLEQNISKSWVNEIYAVKPTT